MKSKKMSDSSFQKSNDPPAGWPSSTSPSWTYEPGHDQAMLETWLFKLRRERYCSRLSTKQHDFFVAEIADAVHVIATDHQDRVLMVRQFRVGSRTDSLETPGGLIDPGEDPLTAAQRELLEETGYQGEQPRLIGAFWSLPSLGTSRIWTVVLNNVQKVAEPHGDPTEELHLEWLEKEKIFDAIRSGDIHHGCVISGLLIWLNGLELPGRI
jgi:ADP-ribose pyrophosphatase